MYLRRFFFLKLSEIPANLSLFNNTHNDVIFETGPIGEANKAFNSVLVTAKIKLKNIPITPNNQLFTPTNERKQCESTMEYISKVFSVGYKLSREIYSPWQRCVTYEAENNEEYEQLIQADISEYENYSVKMHGTPPLLNFDWKSAYSDRQQGLELMADALNHTNSSGQFRDYIRLFENSFNLPTKQLRKKLIQFLNPEFGYTSLEIDKWISLRDPLSHADGKKSNEIFYESDVTPYIQRVRQAAYDVLLNKKIWGNNNPERRNLWSAGAFTTNLDGKSTIRVGAENVVSSIIDPYNAYPVIMGIGLIHISENLFPRLNSDHKKSST